jgi:hypothetical protein
MELCFLPYIIFITMYFASYTLFFLTNRNMTVEVDNKGPAVGCLCSTTLNDTDNTVSFSVDYMLRAFEQYATKDLMLTSYLSTNHWIVVAIVPKQRKVYYLESLKTIKTNTGPLELINEDHVWFEDRWMVATLCGLILG